MSMPDTPKVSSFMNNRHNVEIILWNLTQEEVMYCIEYLHTPYFILTNHSINKLLEDIKQEKKGAQSLYIRLMIVRLNGN